MDGRKITSLINLLGAGKVDIGDERNTVRPTSSEDIEKLIRWANENRIGVGLYKIKGKYSVQIDFSALNTIVEVDQPNLVATVEPGVWMGDIADGLKKFGLRFLPAQTPWHRNTTVADFYFHGFSSATGLKYGSSKHHVMGMEFVLPTGECLRTGGKTVKNVTGYDLTRFFIGPYCNFAVPLKFLLKLFPCPEKRVVIDFWFSNADKGYDFIDSLRISDITPTSVIWLDPVIQHVLGLQAEGMQLVRVELEGFREEVADYQFLICELANRAGSTFISDGGEDLAWNNILKGRGFVLMDELKFLPAQVKESIHRIYDWARSHGIEAGLFGQPVEGKIHFYAANFFPGKHELIRQLLDQIIAWGGVVAGRYSRMYGNGPPGPLDLWECNLKSVLDPNGILLS
ncbi:MAG: FAD-binding oxidoreductase [Desulfocucumaceae bacterium]